MRLFGIIPNNIVNQGQNYEFQHCGVRRNGVTVCMRGEYRGAKGCRGGMENRAETGGCDPQNFFSSKFPSNPKIQHLYIFNTHAPQCSGLNLRLHG